MPWDRSPNAGFTTGEPWLPLAPNAAEICLIWEGYGPVDSGNQQVPDTAPYPKAYYRQYAPWGVRARDLARQIPGAQNAPGMTRV